MSQILNKVRDVDPNNSEAIKEALSPFFQNLSKHTEVDSARWLRALENVINRFPKYCMSQRSNVETYLTHFLDSSSSCTVTEAAKCAHALQQVRPSQEKTATAKSCWRDLLKALCDAAHSLIGALFPHAVDIYELTTKAQNEQATNSPFQVSLSRLSAVTLSTQNNALNNLAVLCTRLRNVFIFLQAMLVETYPVAKPIRPQTILDVIVRALSVSSGTNTGNHSLDDIVTIKIQALRSLDALVACLGPNLIPFSPLVFRFVMQTLKWSSENPSDQSRKVRIAAYSSATQWLSVLHSHCIAKDRGKCWEDELTAHIIEDITPRTHIVELKMSKQPTKNLSKKAKRKLANSMLQESSISSHMPGEKNKVTLSEETNDELAIAALECAETFLTVCGIFLKPATHKRFQERLVRECYVQSCPQVRTVYLLRALEASRKSAPPTVPPPTQYCLQLYSAMINSQHREISNFCSQALLDIRMHLHCSPPSISFAIEVQQETEKRTEEKKKTISERNRAALEELLGADKLTNQPEEVITILDEPSNKKRRLEDDKISVSSESGNSVQISLDSDGNSLQEVEVLIESIDGSIHGDEINEVIVMPVIEEIDDENELIIDDGDGKETQGNVTSDVQMTSELRQFQNDSEQISEDKVDSTQPDNETIYEATTQMPRNTPLNVSNDDDDETPLSMEVAYDYPNTGTEKVTLLEKLEAENIPSSNETDDIQITCGQVVKSSQDVDSDKKLVHEVKSADITINGIENSSEKPLQNGNVSDSNEATIISKDVTVEDMLADFVDEVNEDTQTSVVA